MNTNVRFKRFLGSSIVCVALQIGAQNLMVLINPIYALFFLFFVSK